MRIQNIDARMRFLRVQLFIKGCVLALVLPFIMVITRSHTRVSRKGLCILICGNFPLFRIQSTYCLHIQNDQEFLLSNFETLVSIISAYVQIAFTLHKKVKFSIKDFFSKCEQIRKKLRIWSHLLKKSVMENSIFLSSVYLSLHTFYMFPVII